MTNREIRRKFMSKMNSQQRIIMESDAINLKYLEHKIHQQALNDISQSEYESHIRDLFGRLVLDFAKTLVINLPRSCFANCPYCIDKDLHKNVINYDDFLDTCRDVLEEKHDFNEVSITGGSLPSDKFNELIDIIQKYCPDVRITWNTNGANINSSYNVSHIKYINLHRNSADDKANKELFYTNADIISIEDFKSFAKDKLCIRVTVDEDFDIDDYVKYNTPMYLNRMLPGTFETEKAFDKVKRALNIIEDTDIRRRNHYINGQYKDIPVRLCVGDHLAKHVPGRYPVWLNVVIIHRSGVVAGSWYEDDKFLYKNEKICSNK